MKKKNLLVFLMVILLAFSFSACGNDDSDKDAEADTATEETREDSTDADAEGESTETEDGYAIDVKSEKQDDGATRYTVTLGNDFDWFGVTDEERNKMATGLYNICASEAEADGITAFFVEAQNSDGRELFVQVDRQLKVLKDGEPTWVDVR